MTRSTWSAAIPFLSKIIPARSCLGVVGTPVLNMFCALGGYMLRSCSISAALCMVTLAMPNRRRPFCLGLCAQLGRRNLRNWAVPAFHLHGICNLEYEAIRQGLKWYRRKHRLTQLEEENSFIRSISIGNVREGKRAKVYWSINAALYMNSRRVFLLWSGNQQETRRWKAYILHWMHCW